MLVALELKPFRAKGQSSAESDGANFGVFAAN
jgi:hypothetical protein